MEQLPLTLVGSTCAVHTIRLGILGGTQKYLPYEELLVIFNDVND